MKEIKKIKMMNTDDAKRKQTKNKYLEVSEHKVSLRNTKSNNARVEKRRKHINRSDELIFRSINDFKSGRGIGLRNVN